MKKRVFLIAALVFFHVKTNANSYKDAPEAFHALFAKYAVTPQRAYPINQQTLEHFMISRSSAFAWLNENNAAQFSGRYVLLERGCGTECSQFIVINPKENNGKLALTAPWTAHYYPDSALMILNLEETPGDNPQHIRMSCHTFTEATFSEVPCLVE